MFRVRLGFFLGFVSLGLGECFPFLVSLLTCYHSTQLCPMDTIYIQASSERIPSWPLLIGSTNLLHIDIPSKMFHVNVYMTSTLNTLVI